MNVPALVAHIKDRRLVARAFALFANQFDVGKKLHLDGHGPITLARLAATTRYIERKMTGCESVLVSLSYRSKHFTDRVKRFDISHGIASRRAADGALIHQHHVGDVLSAG